MAFTRDIAARRRVHRVETGGVGDASTLQGHPASDFASALPAVYSNTPPTATSALRGVHILVRDTTLLIDQEMVCLLNSSGGYAWYTIVQSD